MIFLILALFGALPRWSRGRDWGFRPTGSQGIVPIIVVILSFLQRTDEGSEEVSL